MMGFQGVFSISDTKGNIDISENYYSDSIFELKRSSNGKFMNDKLFFIKEDILFLLEGVITNSKELCCQYDENNWEDTFYKLYIRNPKSFFKEFRGSFCGIIYNIRNCNLTLYVDHFRSKDIYYCWLNNKFYFSTNLSYLARLDIDSNKLNISAAYLLLTFGATLEEKTLFKDIKKPPYGTFLGLNKKGELDINDYYKVHINYNLPNTKSKRFYIEKINTLFRQAIDRQFSKDLEYGYNHLVALSAGRDSRMTAWVSHEKGYDKNVLNFTFSESGQLDELIPKKIACDLHNDWIFKSLDNGNCFLDFEEVNLLLCGEICLQTVLHGYSFMKLFNYDKFGLIHTGQLGDVIVGDFGLNSSCSYEKLSYVYSRKLLHKVKAHNALSFEKYSNCEEFTHVNRGIGVTLRSASLFYQYTETFSPFNDLDFFNYCLTIPYNIRRGVKLYDDWMLCKYPEAARYLHNGRVIGLKQYNILGRNISLRELPKRIYKKIRNSILKETPKDGMNPMDYWYKSNANLREKIDSFFKENISKVGDKELREDCIFLYKNGNMGEKMQVITLLSTLKTYFK